MSTVVKLIEFRQKTDFKEVEKLFEEVVANWQKIQKVHRKGRLVY